MSSLPVDSGRASVPTSGTEAWRRTSTAVTAFVGRAAHGPTNIAVPIQSMAEFDAMFGAPTPDSHLGYVLDQFFSNGGEQAIVVRVDEGASGVLGDRSLRLGLYALEEVELFNLLCLPAIDDRDTLAAAVAYCEERGALLLIDAPAAAQTPEQLLAACAAGLFPASSHAAVFYPWPYVANGDRRRLTPPCGSIAGLYARNDQDRGVWKAPAGNLARLEGVKALEHTISDEQGEQLHARGLNCLRIFPGTGAVCWSARTLAGPGRGDPQLARIPVRRMASFLQEAIFRGLEWTLFEPNDEALWLRAQAQVAEFMRSLFVDGAFAGNTADESYQVKCDRISNARSDVAQGLLTLLVGFAPIKPGEFVTLRLQQKAGWNG